ncbi:MAG: ABC transporter ATP-binding protein [Micrococcales bacterium]|nr:ABC transporter ATP-binding protein [Micrococcales bacterium]
MTPAGSAHPAEGLRGEDLRLRYDGADVVRGIDLRIRPGAVTAIVGANGCGKSTLLRGLARQLVPHAGSVTLDGADVRRLPSRELARRVGLLPQQPSAPEGIGVADLVSRGRYPHHGFLGGWDATDSAAVAAALEETGVSELASASVDQLSGGQRQRVWIALALAQEPEILLLDEPTTFLDLAHQLEVLDLLARLNRVRGTTVAMVLHDLGLAARYADDLVVLKEGRILAAGAPGEVLDAELVADAFGLDALVIPDPVTGTPLVVPRGTASGLG